MNPPQADHCSACGRDLGLEPLGEPGTLRCPHCPSSVLEVFSGGPGQLFDCAQCGGQFVEHALLKDLLERRQVYGHAAPRKPTAPQRVELVKYIPCPECDTLMMRRNFGTNSGVIVDVCARHGIWFDVGELPRVMAFVEQGGMMETQKVKARATPQPPSRAVVLPPSSRNPDLLDDLTDAAHALLGFVSGVLRR